MIDELHAQKLLGPFRGEKAPDIDALIKSLVGLSRLGLEVPEIKEIDVNPLLVSADGKITAVDALIILDGEDKKDFSAQADLIHIWKLFNPPINCICRCFSKYQQMGTFNSSPVSLPENIKVTFIW